MTEESTQGRVQRRSRLPLSIALAAGLIGVVAIAAGVAAGGPNTNASGAANAVPLVANATPTPGTGGQGTQPGQNGQGGPWLRGGGPMGGMKDGGMRVGGIRGGVTVAAISGSQLSLKTDDGWTRTIDASGATIAKEGQAASLGDIKVGDEIRFQQTRNADGTYTVTAIDIELPHVAGTVTAAGGSTITLKEPDGSTATVNLTSSTTFRVAGKQNATIADITVGSVVMAWGTRNADGSITATTVRAFTPGQAGQGMPRRGWGRDGQNDQNNQQDGNGQQNGNGWNGMGRPGHGWDNGQDDGGQGQPNASAMPGA